MLRRKVVVIVVCLCWTLYFAKSQNNSDADNRWDLLMMSQSWAPNFCLYWLQKGNNHTCRIPNRNSWTMHGIWVAGKVEGWTMYCNNSWILNTEEIKEIKPELDRLWPNVESDGGYQIWSHEWLKHGTCTASLEPLNSPLKYFKQGLNWITQYSMTGVLNEAGILPSNDASYYIEDIFNAILSKLRAKPEFICKDVNDKQLLIDVIICFNSSLHLTDCVRKRNYNLQPGVTPDPNEVEGMPYHTSCDLSRKTVYLRSVDNLNDSLNISNDFEQ